jgi:predicted MFS family arabinose efflux permease
MAALERRRGRDRVVGEGAGPARLTLAASGALAATVVPVFLTGALSRPMGEDLGFGAAAAGLAVSTFFVAAGLAAPLMARLTQRVGTRTAMRVGVTISGLGCLAVAGLVRSYWQLLAVLVVGGAVVGLVDTAAAGAFASAIRRRRQGIAFGIKEASVPIASMIAGVAVPVAAGWLGWRGAFVGVVVLFPVVWLAVPATGRSPEAPGAQAPPGGTAPVRDGLRTVRLMALGIALGAGAANAAATLLVPSVTEAGLSAGAAGLLLSVASAAAVVIRLGAGWASDRSTAPPARWVAGGLGLGALGTIALAAGGPPSSVVVGAVLALGAGWGWTGLAFLAAVRAAPSAPARAAGIVLTGLAVGGAAGPAAFAALSARAGTSAAWWLASAGFLLGAATTAWSTRGSVRG